MPATQLQIAMVRCPGDTCDLQLGLAKIACRLISLHSFQSKWLLVVLDIWDVTTINQQYWDRTDSEKMAVFTLREAVEPGFLKAAVRFPWMISWLALNRFVGPSGHLASS